ncbi:MAG TPA: hypothetical protein HA263_01855 [Methanoregulaceae archaeon]|nr:hypothetical protein [Methanoregulaceae archaeon]
MEPGRYTLSIGPPLFPVDLLDWPETDRFATRCLYGNSSRVLTHLPRQGANFSNPELLQRGSGPLRGRPDGARAPGQRVVLKNVGRCLTAIPEFD